MSLTNAQLKAVGSNLRTIANGGDVKVALHALADLFDPQPAPKPTPAPSGPLGGSGSWKQVFNDDFNGSSLDTSKWRLGGIEKANGNMKPYNDTEQGFYSNGQVSVANGNLALTAIKRQVTATKNPTDALKDHFVVGLDRDTYYSDWLTGSW